MRQPHAEMITGMLLLAACQGDGGAGGASIDGATDAQTSVPDAHLDSGGDGDEQEGTGDGDSHEDGHDAGPTSDSGMGPQAGHCAPGTFAADFANGTGFPGKDISENAPNHSQNCLYDWYTEPGKAGVTTPYISVSTIQLATSVHQGSAFSFSYHYSGDENYREFELWGTNAACGKGSTATFLGTAVVEVGNHVLCFDVEPAQTFSHLLLSYRYLNSTKITTATLVIDDATFCTSGSCPR